MTNSGLAYEHIFANLRPKGNLKVVYGFRL